jgi:hypothetical protein
LTTTTGTTEQMDRIVVALEDILRVAIEIGGVAEKPIDEIQDPKEELEVGIPGN